VRNSLTDAAKKAGVDDTPASMYAFLIERVRANLHIVLGMSPVGEPFRYIISDRLRPERHGTPFTSFQSFFTLRSAAFAAFADFIAEILSARFCTRVILISLSVYFLEQSSWTKWVF